jgi:IS5 family transposase
MLKASSTDKIIVDTSVLPKVIAHPTDSQLLEEKSRQHYLVKLADALHQLLVNKQSQAQDLLRRVSHILTQKNKNKLYALYDPEVECISKGKARTPYEFGVKVTMTTALKEGLVVGMRSMPGNPWDGHTLDETIEQVSILIHIKTDGKLSRNPIKAVLGHVLHADMCGAGHNTRTLRLICARFRFSLQEVLQAISVLRRTNYGGAV